MSAFIKKFLSFLQTESRYGEMNNPASDQGIHYNLRSEKDKKTIDLLLAEKNQRLVEMSEYNKRQDKTITVYITGLYAAIGVGVSNKFDLRIGSELFYVPIAFAFVFLNLCIVIHAVSQGSWLMSQAKYIHFVIDLRLKDIMFSNIPTVKSNKGSDTPFSCTWDDWTWEIKGSAITTRSVVVFLWILLVHAISITALALVNLDKYNIIHKEWFTIGGVILFILVWYFWYSFTELTIYSFNFHTHPDMLKGKLITLISILIGLLFAVGVRFTTENAIQNIKFDINKDKVNNDINFKLEGKVIPNILEIGQSQRK